MRKGALEAGWALLLLLWVGPALAQSLTRAEQPQVKVGDASEYRDRDVMTGEIKETSFRVVTLDQDKIVLETAGSTSGTQTFTREWNIVETKRGNVVAERISPFRPTLQFPLTMGKRWQAEFDYEGERGRSEQRAHWHWTAVVVGVESVTVPGGTFAAFRVDGEGSFETTREENKWTGTHKETVWYAPAISRIVKREYEETVPSRHFVNRHVTEMVSFTPAK